mmetsp:Transcript_172/g.427  ORF Transcript_172/g.427 Transcript_172/m.427 type:complete len:111 (+) Transcript_172:553-885(+)
MALFSSPHTVIKNPSLQQKSYAFDARMLCFLESEDFFMTPSKCNLKSSVQPTCSTTAKWTAIVVDQPVADAWFMKLMTTRECNFFVFGIIEDLQTDAALSLMKLVDRSFL